MSYIGRKPTVGNFQICDAISVVNNQAAYTMQVGSVNVLPETANHMIVSLNGVIQKPNSSYTIAGAVITFSSALVTGDVINFIQILGSVLDLGVPSDDTVTASKLSSNAVTTAKINNDAVTVDKLNLISTGSVPSLEAKGTSGVTEGYIQLNCAENTHGIKIKSPPHSAGASYTLTMPNNDGDANQFLQTNGSGVLSFAAAGGDNTPAFHVYNSGNQNVSVNTETQVVFNTEIVDTDNAFASNQFTVPSGEGGKYYIYFQLTYSTGTDCSYQHILKIDNSVNADSGFIVNGYNFYYDTHHYARIIDLSAGNVLKITTYQNGGTLPISSGENRPVFGGYKLIGV